MLAVDFKRIAVIPLRQQLKPSQRRVLAVINEK